MSVLRLGWQFLRRDLRSGELRLLLAALVLSVCAVSSVGFITDRAQGALILRANSLLGGDAVLRADQPIAEEVRARAGTLGLAHTETRAFPSMVRSGEAMQLGEIKAMDAGFPLRGQFLIRTAGSTGSMPAAAVPESGEAWLSVAGARRLQVEVGDTLSLGRSSFRISALVVEEPDAVLDYFNVAPRVFIRLADLAATGLEQPGSRITYRVVVAGEPAAVRAWRAQVREDLGRGQRLESADDARPELRNALRRADRFLALAALVAVVVSGLAVAMAARRHARRHLDGCAVLRCLGASQHTLLGIYLVELLGVALLAAAIGLALAWGIQAGVVAWLGSALNFELPAATWRPAAFGLAVALAVLAGFAVPPVMSLRSVPAMRVLRRDLGATEPSAWVLAVLSIGSCALLMMIRADSWEVGGLLLLGVVATLGALALIGGILISVLRRFRGALRGGWRQGVAVLSRRGSGSVVQLSALGLGLMVLMLLALLRGDLLQRWQALMPADVPNRFLINVQKDQVDAVEAQLRAAGIAQPTLYPMVRARWTQRNGEPAALGELQGRGRRLGEREFNLSWSDALRSSDNKIVQGSFWEPGDRSRAQMSVEEGLAGALGWKLGDRIGFDVAGTPVEAEITSLRQVDWERFQPNFFVVFSPGVLDNYPASHISAFRVNAAQAGSIDDLVRAFPNLSVIDIDAVVSQVRSVADQVSRAVQAVFLFTLVGGLLVLIAAIGATQDERLLEGSVMRAFGASRWQLRGAHLAEFSVLGLLAAFTASLAASAVAGVLGDVVLDLPWSVDASTLLLYGLIGTGLIVISGLLMTASVVRTPPAQTLRVLQT